MPSAATQSDYEKAKAWPFEQAKLILRRLDIEKKRGIDRGDRPVLFETGYGPSGLPHIGTFGEVARTTMVLNAFRALTDNKIATRLICFSDDLDGFRKVPSNMPKGEMLETHLGKPLIGCARSIWHVMIAMRGIIIICCASFWTALALIMSSAAATEEYRVAEILTKRS